MESKLELLSVEEWLQMSLENKKSYMDKLNAYVNTLTLHLNHSAIEKHPVKDLN